MRKSITAAAVLGALLVLALSVDAEAPHAAQRGSTAPKGSATEQSSAGQLAQARAVLEDVREYRRQTWRWQRLMGVRPTPTGSAAASPDLEYRIWVRDLWRKRATAVRRKALNPPHKQQWQCIHRFEGGWGSNTGNGYYGGLQMDITFQRHYGSWLLRRKGTANRWTPIEQMWVAERAHRSGRGFYPWPNTARNCGLI